MMQPADPDLAAVLRTLRDARAGAPLSPIETFAATQLARTSRLLDRVARRIEADGPVLGAKKHPLLKTSSALTATAAAWSRMLAIDPRSCFGERRAVERRRRVEAQAREARAAVEADNLIGRD